METVLPKRKSHHLQGYDYSQNGAYFITICTHQRRMLFGPNRAPVGADSISARMAARVFREIIGQYPAVQCRYFVVMPNHFHALVEIERARADMESAPTFFCRGGQGALFCLLCVQADLFPLSPCQKPSYVVYYFSTSPQANPVQTGDAKL